LDGRNSVENSTQTGGPGARRPRAFFGVRHPALRALVALVVVAALACGCYMAYYRHVIKPRRDKEIESGEYTKKLYQRWKSKGKRGWERLFAEAKKGYPGYSVDIGRPARQVLISVGAEIKPFMEEKLRTGDFAGRMTAIDVLGAVGEPMDRIIALLERELANTSDRRQEVAVLKCACAAPEPGLALMKISLDALESPNASTRYKAAGYLADLATKEGAPDELVERVADLQVNGKLWTRIDFAVARRADDPRTAYEMLLEGLASDDAKALAVAESHIIALRDADHHTPAMTPEAQAAAIADHRTFLNMELAMLDIEERPREVYALLLEMLDNEDRQIVDTAANHVAALRGEGEIKHDTTDEQRLELIEADRTWLEAQLAEPETSVVGAAEPEAGEQPAGETSADEAPSGETSTDEQPADAATGGSEAETDHGQTEEEQAPGE
jgi:hypothetical protein